MYFNIMLICRHSWRKRREEPSLELPHLWDKGVRQSHEPTATPMPSPLPSAQRTREETEIEARVATHSNFFLLSYCLTAVSLPPCQVPGSKGEVILIICVSAQTDASAAQGNRHPVLVDYVTRLQGKQPSL